MDSIANKERIFESEQKKSLQQHNSGIVAKVKQQQPHLKSRGGSLRSKFLIVSNNYHLRQYDPHY